MRKMHTEKTDSFIAHDLNHKEYLIHEFTLYNDIQVPEQPPRKVALTKSYKTDSGEHVNKRDDTNFLILTDYGKKNIEILRSDKFLSKYNI
ncbi:MAG: hypothetical protein JXB88_15735 [Spirochaetales bacterium]|nr:hypothetical protein [Spirochaetales bacterium]